MNKHTYNKKMIIAKKVVRLHYKNWLVNNIKDRKIKANKNRIELFDNKKLIKSLPLNLLNNIRIKIE